MDGVEFGEGLLWKSSSDGGKDVCWPSLFFEGGLQKIATLQNSLSMRYE